MSGPYGYGGYGGYAPPAQPGGGGYSYPPGGGFPPPGGAPPPPAPRQQYPPGQQQHPPAYSARPPAGYNTRHQYPPGQQPAGYQGYQQAPAYGMPGYRPPITQPQGYTPAVSAGYTPVGAPNTGYTPVTGAPTGAYTSQNIPTSVPGGPVPTPGTPPMYRPPGRAAPPPPNRGPVSTHPSVPVVPDSFPELNTMSTEELESLMDSETAQVQYFEGRDDIKRLQEDRKKIVERNEELATTNLSLKPQLEEKQQELIELYAELDGKRNELSDLQQQRQALADHYAPHNILTRLKIAAADIEEESEGIAENFLNGDIPIDEFLKTYIPKKTLCHSRRAKEEKMERMGI